MARAATLSPGFIDRHGVAKDALDKTIDALRMRYNKVELEGAQFFRTAEPTGGTYKESTISNVLELPAVSEDSDDVPIRTPVRGFKKSFSVVTYRAGIKVERAALEDELHSDINRMASGLLDSGRRLLEYAFADVFNNATSTATAYKGADGVSLANDSHPFENPAQGTWDNLQTAGAFTHANFNTARTSMATRTDEFGNPMVIMPTKVVCVPAIEDAVRRVISSEKIAGFSINDANPWKNSVDIFVYHYLTGSTKWMLWGNIPKEFCGLIYAPKVTPSVSALEGSDMSTDIVGGQRLRMRFAYGFTVEKNLEYNAGA
jgi:hypothetical protein